jgi:hypothetical protein
VEAVLGEGSHWIAPSRFGYLGSDMPEAATWDEQADAFAFLLDHLRIKQAAVVALPLMRLEEMDLEGAGRQLGGPQGEEQRRAIYGVDETHLAGGGPSVASVNEVVASLAVTEFVAGVTGLREPVPLLTYRGWPGIVSKRSDPLPDCYYCGAVRGKRGSADVERYIRNGVGEYL